MTTCDNIKALHWPKVLSDQGAVVAYCQLCGETKVFRMSREGRMDNRAYSKWFKRDIIQPPHPLYYKYHESQVSIL